MEIILPLLALGLIPVLSFNAASLENKLRKLENRLRKLENILEDLGDEED